MDRRSSFLAAVAVAAAALVAAGPAALRPDAAHAAPVVAAQSWPVPVPDWFWPWARWYLGRAEFADEPLRSDATRPDAAPRAIPAWAWRRLAVLLGQEPPPVQEPEPETRPLMWPLPIPGWFWSWAEWYLGRDEFAGRAQDPALRPAAVPRLIPEWAWQRLVVLEGGAPLPLPGQTLRVGATGRAVEGLQRALNAAGYPAGPIDGRFGAKTKDAVIAWEKLRGRPREGTVTPDEYADVIRTLRPSAPLSGRDRYVYVDLGRQVLFEVAGGRVRNVIAVSTGGGYVYTGLDDREHLATTPPGSYRVYRKVPGWDESYLGRLYYPSYYSGGYAIHGSKSVPVTPASHGCVRIPVWLALGFYRRTGTGTPVIVR